MLVIILGNLFMSIFISIGFAFLNNRKVSIMGETFLSVLIFIGYMVGFVTKSIFVTIFLVFLMLFIYNKFIKKEASNIKSITISFFMITIVILSDIMANLIYNILISFFVKIISYNRSMNIDKLIYIITEYCFILLFSRLIGEILKKPIKRNKKNKFKYIYVWLNIGICALMITVSFLFNRILRIEDVRVYISNLIIFILAIFSAIFSVYIFNKYSLKDMEVKRKSEEIERMEEYARYMEELYINIRKFKHDYKNILLSLSCYIENKEYEQLEIYFNETILPTEAYIDKNDFLVKLKNINILPLKSIIISKLMKAQNMGINIYIDIAEEINELPMEYIDSMRIFGILLDNALEASEETQEKILNFGIIKKSNSIVFVIENSCKEHMDYIYKLTQKGFSTKGKNRGFGLYNLKEIVNKYDNVTLNLESNNKIFTAEIWIRL